jgi:hypothetical protein
MGLHRYRHVHYRDTVPLQVHERKTRGVARVSEVGVWQLDTSV